MDESSRAGCCKGFASSNGILAKLSTAGVSIPSPLVLLLIPSKGNNPLRPKGDLLTAILLEEEELVVEMELGIELEELGDVVGSVLVEEVVVKNLLPHGGTTTSHKDTNDEEHDGVLVREGLEKLRLSVVVLRLGPWWTSSRRLEDTVTRE